MNIRTSLRALLFLAGTALPVAATATGREMGPLGGIVILMGFGGLVLLQLFTLITYTNLPPAWPRLLRVFLAVFLPLMALATIWLGLALS